MSIRCYVYVRRMRIRVHLCMLSIAPFFIFVERTAFFGRALTEMKAKYWLRQGSHILRKKKMEKKKKKKCMNKEKKTNNKNQKKTKQTICNIFLNVTSIKQTQF